MKHAVLGILLCLSLLTGSCEDVDLMRATEAGIDAIKAATLSDGAVRELAMEAARYSDSRNTLAPDHSKYSRRLQALTAGHVQKDGLILNFKVYITPEINAFAMADGTIRIYSGLMDMMDDRELLFVIGHEIGHVKKDHIRKKIQLAYAGRAVRKGAAALNNEVGMIARSQIGGFAEKLVNAQFSQQEEREADDYGLDFLADSGHEPQAALSALRKLAALGSTHTFLSSHPDPDKRADRLEARLRQSASTTVD